MCSYHTNLIWKFSSPFLHGTFLPPRRPGFVPRAGGPRADDALSPPHAMVWPRGPALRGPR